LTTRSPPIAASDACQYYVANSFCPGLIEDGTIFALLHDSGLIDLLEELFGQRATARCNDTAQIALRLPDYQTKPGHWPAHIDGFPAGLNTVPQGTVSRQTALIGVYLSEARPNMGNLATWPGAHRRIAQFMRDIDAPGYLRQNGAEALLAAAITTELGDPEQLTVAPGDAVITHHLLAHSAAWNLSLQIRYAVYFRLLHRDDDAHDPAPLMSESRFFAGVPW
jgi:Phytanoyl-CoA dioxygenase (PhyH)